MVIILPTASTYVKNPNLASNLKISLKIRLREQLFLSYDDALTLKIMETQLGIAMWNANGLLSHNHKIKYDL